MSEHVEDPLFEELREEVLTENAATSPNEQDSFALLDAVVAAHGAGERRPQQETMVRAVDNAIKNNENLIVQAGTGVGKSLGYLIPVVANGGRAVISTATKQLSEQVALEDVPFLQTVFKETYGKEFSAAILKGRSNYACLNRIKKIKDLDEQDSEQGTIEELNTLDEDYSEATVEDYDNASTIEKAKIGSAQAQKIIRFLDLNPDTSGDRSVLPVAHDAVWATVSSTAQQCVGASACPFASACYSEKARLEANHAQVVVTNHHLAATDMPDPTRQDPDAADNDQWNLLGKRDLVVFDEAHELDDALLTSWGAEMNPKIINDFVSMARRNIPASGGSTATRAREALTTILELSDTLAEILSNEEEPRRIVNGWEPEYNRLFKALAIQLRTVLAYAETMSGSKSEQVELAKNIEILTDSLAFISRGYDIKTVLWIEKSFDRVTIKGAPLQVGPELTARLNNLNTPMIMTSATIAVNKSFNIARRNWALDESIFMHDALDVGTPFNYPKQGILYIPEPKDFPAPTGKDRTEHSEAVPEAFARFIKAAGGRTLALSSTRSGAQKIAKYLRENIDTPVISQFDAEPAVVIKQFIEDETSTLVATMGMWHGLNVPGKSLSQVLIDKIPFPPFNDPHITAQQDYVQANGGNGFMDISVGHAARMLAQGVGRLVRSSNDKGLVAVFDTRLNSARYASRIINSLPDMWRTNDEALALKAISRLVQD